jgi:hypothetical protein
MSAVTFDTLKFVEKLKAAGMPEAQAKAIAEAHAEALSESVSSILAIKTDLAELKVDLNQLDGGYSGPQKLDHRLR